MPKVDGTQLAQLGAMRLKYNIKLGKKIYIYYFIFKYYKKI